MYDKESALLPLAVRAAALREAFADQPHVRIVHGVDDVPIDYDDPAIWDEHVAIFRAGLDAPVDAVFTSESYGDELARRLECRHVRLDVQRSWQSVSGTRLREDPARYWSELLPAVKSALAKRIVVLGAESTGTTTLAHDLAASLGTTWVPEFGREHTILKAALAGDLRTVVWDEADFMHVARIQRAWEDAAARTLPHPLLVLDTDAVATAVWHERYLDRPAPALEPLIDDLPRRTLYVLTDHDGVPFEDDGWRDGAHLRAWMTERFEEELTRRALPWIKVTGTRTARLAQTKTEAESHLGLGWIWS